MGFQLPLVTQEITFGHLLQQEMDNVPVLASQVDTLHLLLSTETIFVKLEQEMMDLLLFPAIHYIWDGQGCAGSNTCCEFNNPLWFCKQLDPEPTTEDIEIRIMGNVVGAYRSLENEDTPVQLIEIYVQ